MEVGETVEEAVVRETREETGIEVRPTDVVIVTDYIEREAKRIRWHYVLIEVLCEYVRGEPFPGSDAENARFIETRDLDDLDVAPGTRETIEKAVIARREERNRPETDSSGTQP